MPYRCLYNYVLAKKSLITKQRGIDAALKRIAIVFYIKIEQLNLLFTQLRRCFFYYISFLFFVQ